MLMKCIASIETGRTAANRSRSLQRAGDFRKGRLVQLSEPADFQSWVTKPCKHMKNVSVMRTFTFGIATMRNESINKDWLASGLEIVQRVIKFFEKKINQTVSRYKISRYRADQDGSRENSIELGAHL